MAAKGNRFKAREEAADDIILDEKPEKKARVKKPAKSEKDPGKSIRVLNSFKNFTSDERTHKITGLFLILISVFLLIAFTSFFFTWRNDQSMVTGSWLDLLRFSDRRVENWLGKMGAIASHQFMHNWFGIASFAFVLVSFLSGFRILFKADLLPLRKVLRYSTVILLYLPPALSFLFSRHSEFLFMGGGIGFEINHWLTLTLGKAGTGFFLAFTGLAFIVVAFNPAFKLPFARKSKTSNADVIEDFEPGNIYKDETLEEEPFIIHDDPYAHRDEIEEKIQEPEIKKAPVPEIHIPVAELDLEVNTDDFPTLALEVEQTQPEKISTNDEIVVNDEEASLVEQLGEYDPTLDLSSYQYPTLDLLQNYQSSRSQMSREELMAELEANKKKIIETLGHYDIEIDKIKATVGPTVTLFEIVPKAGIRISKIKNLEDDIALSLAALGIRIIAPIPGKGTIGIEVPNQTPDIVSMRSVLASEKFTSSDMELPIGLGKTISNEVFVTDLAKMPHLLMAGATGQGKSVGLNAILVSLLYKKHPAQVKFILVDPKKVELTLFKTIERHFLAKLPGEEDAIITDTKKVVNTLNSLCIEMDNRYDLLKDAQVRNIREYNAKFISRKLNPNNGHRFLPYIVLVVDEFADLIMTAGKEIETPIARLAQLARAIGIHLIIATQRPSVNIITGTIKANFPARLAFRVTSKIDSRTILDAGGADQLIGRGDMLLSTGADLIRVQCAFVDTPEVDEITKFIGDQRGYPNPYMLPEYVGEGESSGGAGDIGSDDFDPLFDEAAHMVVQFQQGSASLLQRRLKLGYNRAGRLVDQLEAAGIIGPFEGSKAREVRCKDMASLEQLLKTLKSPTGV